MGYLKKLAALYRQSETALKNLEYVANLDGKRLKLYGAGRKFDGTGGYFRVFPRDSFTSAFLLNDAQFLKNLLIFCAKTQGKKYDPMTGEEPGKVPHECPGVAVRGRNTLYASVDSTLLFLIGMGMYLDWTGDGKFLQKMRRQIDGSLKYLLRHLKRNLFWDDPKYCGAKEYALWSGCWRDGGYPERKHREHIYPASYLMVNIFAVRALRVIGRLAEMGIIPRNKSSMLQKLADGIKNATVKNFWLPHKGYFASAIDKGGVIETLYLDSIWPLYFLEAEDVSSMKIEKIFKALKSLETPFGYLSRERLPGYDYEGKQRAMELTIWPYEHAYLAKIAEKFGILEVLEKTLLPINVLYQHKFPFSEYIALEKTTVIPSGCHLQLWTIAYIVGESLLFLPRGN